MGDHFDDLTKALAKGTGRRTVLRKMGAGLLGAIGLSIAAGTLGTQEAQAAPSACSQYCGKQAFVSGPSHAACLQACRSCGGGAYKLCYDYRTGTFTCCTSGQFCGDGTCIPFLQG